MKKYILLLFSILALYMTDATAQNADSWMIKLNKDVLIRTPVETSEPVIYLSKSAVLKSKSIFSIEYTSSDPQKDWNRIFSFKQENEQSLKEVKTKNQSGSISFDAKDLQKAAKANQPVFLYTMSLPNDPEMAAMVRVRRFLLCKIQWKN